MKNRILQSRFCFVFLVDIFFATSAKVLVFQERWESFNMTAKSSHAMMTPEWVTRNVVAKIQH